MPNVDGLMATKQIREITGPVANLLIVAVTGSATNVDRDAYRMHGLTGFVAKPIDWQILVTEIEAATAADLPSRSGVDRSDQSAPEPFPVTRRA